MFLNLRQTWSEGAIEPKFSHLVEQVAIWIILHVPTADFIALGMVLLNPYLNCRVLLFLAIQVNPRTHKDIWHDARRQGCH